MLFLCSYTGKCNKWSRCPFSFSYFPSTFCDQKGKNCQEASNYCFLNFEFKSVKLLSFIITSCNFMSQQTFVLHVFAKDYCWWKLFYFFFISLNSKNIYTRCVYFQGGDSDLWWSSESIKASAWSYKAVNY